MSLTIASTFSGVGGIDLAFERAGCRTALLCEKDKHAAAVLRHHWPDTPIHDDITELTADDLHAAGCRPESTVLVGGFPCQDLSVAGARRGMGEGTRSGLYWHLDRLMAEFRPAWVVFENVPGLLSSQDGRDMGAVVGSLAERGYGWAYRVLDAQHFGVPQRRRRVVIVGRLGDSGAAPARVLLEPEGGDRDSASGGSSGAVAAASPARGVVSALTANGVGTCGPDDNQAQAGHFVPMTFVTPLAVRGRDGGAQIEVGATNERTPSGGSSQAMVAVTTLGDRTHALTAEGHDASEDGTGRGTPIIAATLTASTSRQGIGTPGRRQEDDHNLVAFQPQAGGDSALSIGATAPCLSVGQQAAIASHTEVRRLTPLECERLQGHPDGWTSKGTKPDGTTYEQSDSRRYKQMGNGVAAPVFEWVAHRVVAEHNRLTQAGAA